MDDSKYLSQVNEAAKAYCKAAESYLFLLSLTESVEVSLVIEEGDASCSLLTGPVIGKEVVAAATTTAAVAVKEALAALTGLAGPPATPKTPLPAVKTSSVAPEA